MARSVGLSVTLSTSFSMIIGLHFTCDRSDTVHGTVYIIMPGFTENTEFKNKEAEIVKSDYHDMITSA